MLGICNGFQILTEARLLPGVLRANASLSFVCRDVPLRVERDDTPFTTRCSDESRHELTIPVKNGEGCWFADEELLAELEAQQPDRPALRARGQPERGDRRRRRRRQCRRNVFGLMPHPEHAVDPLLGSTDGALILGSLVDAAAARSLAAVG